MKAEFTRELKQHRAGNYVNILEITVHRTANRMPSHQREIARLQYLHEFKEHTKNKIDRASNAL